jgi:hypothetical protein
MFSARLLFEDRSRGDLASVVVLIASSVIYLLLRKLFTSGYEHQIDPYQLVTALISFRPSRDFWFQSVLTQGLILVLLVSIALRNPRYAAYLLLSAGAVTMVGMAARESQFALLWGEPLPYYAAFFFVTQFGVAQQNAPPVTSG